MSLTAPLLPAAHALAAGASEWIVPYADGPADNAWADLPLPHLQALLAALSPSPVVQGSEFDFSPPHERALARAMGLPDTPGLIPWAALSVQETAQACAFITPCHWHIGADHVHQADPAATPLTEEESQQLLALLSPWFADDGIALQYLQPDLWLARGNTFEHLATASMDRVQNRDVRPWFPDATQGAVIQRLQSEVQMLLYTHVFNDRRAALGQQPINAFWVHGSGRLPAPVPMAGSQAGSQTVCIDDLRTPALQGNVPAWRKAWQQLDDSLIAQLRQRAERGEPVRLTLSGERNAVQWVNAPRGLIDKIKHIFAPKRFPNLRDML
ncbi:hypothetical protein GCM10010975_03880 [Comamonas phosphati]|nr:hypothetical protein GCM10010975_03880 [Comamonas phosphati]